jgi:TPP-dependent pyruvate/acetoin dehydrogenase alpha subunit
VAAKKKAAAKSNGGARTRAPKLAPNLANDDIGEAVRRRLYVSQLECRQIEQKAYDLFLQNLIKGTSHLGLGQEAIAAGFATAMQPTDYTFCTYRGHNHTLARGASMEGVLGELMGRQCGLLGGKGGSMHLTSVEHGAMGSYAIIGAHLPIAMGAAWSAQYRGTDQVSVCFFGDGTTNIGADRASAYGMESIIVDGNDADEVYRTAQAAFTRARAGEGPSLIEAKTYRHSGHSRADPATYRPDGELEEWLKRDPIPTYRQRMLDFGIAEKDIVAIETDVTKRVDAAVETAKASPPPAEDVLMTQVWSDGGSAWRN